MATIFKCLSSTHVIDAGHPGLGPFGHNFEASLHAVHVPPATLRHSHPSAAVESASMWLESHVTLVHVEASLHAVHVPPATLGQPASHPLVAVESASMWLESHVTLVHVEASLHAVHVPPATLGHSHPLVAVESASMWLESHVTADGHLELRVEGIDVCLLHGSIWCLDLHAMDNELRRGHDSRRRSN